MEAEERKKIEAAMAQISREKRAVEPDPAGVMQRSIDGARAEAKRRLLRVILWVAMAVALAGMVVYWLRFKG